MGTPCGTASTVGRAQMPSVLRGAAGLDTAGSKAARCVCGRVAGVGDGGSARRRLAPSGQRRVRPLRRARGPARAVTRGRGGARRRRREPCSARMELRPARAGRQAVASLPGARDRRPPDPSPAPARIRFVPLEGAAGLPGGAARGHHLGHPLRPAQAGPRRRARRRPRGVHPGQVRPRASCARPGATISEPVGRSIFRTSPPGPSSDRMSSRWVFRTMRRLCPVGLFRMVVDTAPRRFSIGPRLHLPPPLPVRLGVPGWSGGALSRGRSGVFTSLSTRGVA